MKFLDLFSGIGACKGFPDWAFDKAQEVNSDSQLYKQAGNSVTVNVIKVIAERLDK